MTTLQPATIEPEAIARPAASTPELRAVIRNIFVCYFFSGAAGLVYQILWLRKLLLVFGSTVHAVSTVLTVFFGGLALGSWCFGRLIDRREGQGLRWYGLLECGVGLYAFLTPWLFDAIRHVYIPIYRASGLSPHVLVGASFVCAAAILLIPTTLLGGTFPVLSRFLIRSRDERGMKIASLYGINTAGAMVGTLGVYFIGLPVIGLLRTLWCMGVLNLGIGMLCLVFHQHLERLGFLATSHGTVPRPASMESERSMRDVRWLLLAFGLSGFSAMVYEVAWTRALSLIVGSSIYAFCLMLATFLGGIALGSGWARRALRRHSAMLSSLMAIEVGLGAYGLLSIPLLTALPNWFVAFWSLAGRTFSGMVGVQSLVSIVAMLLPTLLMGLLFPLVSDLVTGRFAQLGQRLGSAYAINTVGGILGSFVSGFMLIPLFGLSWAIAVAAVVNLAAGGVLYSRFGRRHATWWRAVLSTAAVSGALILAGVVVVPLWQRQVFAAGVYLDPMNYQRVNVAQAAAQSQLLYYRDSLNATVSVHQSGETLFLKVGGKTDASNSVDMATQILSAHLPLLLHPHPTSALVIGLGSGVTLGHASRYPLSRLDCAELDPAVIEAAKWFKPYNYNIHEDPRTRIVAADGRNFLLASAQQYDVIISEPSNPWMAGLAYLFTQEYYQLAKQRLAPGGLMCQWLQLYRLFPGDVKLMLRTFHEAFPYVSVWTSIPGDILLIGSMTPQTLTSEELAQRMAAPKVRESLAGIHLEQPDALLQLYLFNQVGIDELTQDIPWIHQDDQPLVEFSAPKALYLGATALDTNYQGLEQFKGRPDALVSGYRAATDDAAVWLARATVWESRGQLDRARELLEHAVVLDPRSSDAWARLGALYVKTGQDVKAQEALTKALDLVPNNAAAARTLARLYWQQRQLPQAQQTYQQATRTRAPDGPFAEEMGDCFRQGGSLRWAAEYYRSSLSQGGATRRHLLLMYADVLDKLHADEEQERFLTFAQGQFANETAFPLGLAQLFVEQQRWQDAAPLFARVVSVEPTNARAYYGLARVAFAQGAREQAARLLRRCLLYQPYDRQALELLRHLESQTRSAPST